MDTKNLQEDVKSGLDKLAQLRDEVKLHIHLATLDAKKEWDEKLSPKVLEVEQSAKSITESSKSTLHDVLTKVEEFLGKIRGTAETKRSN